MTEMNARVLARKALASFLTDRINLIGGDPEHLEQLARELGYLSGATIRQFASGEASLPLDKAPAMANALGVDPWQLFRMAMEQFTARSIFERMFERIVSEEEFQVIRHLRALTGAAELTLTADLRRRLEELIALGGGSFS